MKIYNEPSSVTATILLLKIFNELKGIDLNELSTAEHNILKHMVKAGILKASINVPCGYDVNNT